MFALNIYSLNPKFVLMADDQKDYFTYTWVWTFITKSSKNWVKTVEDFS